MAKGLTAAIGGVVAYIVINELIVAIVTGTGVGDTLITTIGPIVAAVAAVVIILGTMRGK